MKGRTTMRRLSACTNAMRVGDGLAPARHCGIRVVQRSGRKCGGDALERQPA